jgi:uncharacterized protein YidB (DUF937 family)
MGFLEDMADKGLGGLTNNSNRLVSSVMQMINNQPGGLAGLVRRFHERGLGGLVSSWVSTGQNLPVSSDELQHVLGSEQVRELAARAGISPETASSNLVQLLPMIVDKLTPNGQLPPSGTLLDSGLSMLRGLGKTGTEA